MKLKEFFTKRKKSQSSENANTEHHDFSKKQPKEAASPSKASKKIAVKLKVIGVGGCGDNFISRFIEDGRMVDLITAQTDIAILEKSFATTRIQMGPKSTRKKGCGGKPEIGRAAAEESLDALKGNISDTDILIIVAGMGGGTGSGSVPVIAKLAREMGVFTVGAVTMPFNFEGSIRAKNANDAVIEFRKYVDALIEIPNEKVLETVDYDMSFKDALQLQVEVIHQLADWFLEKTKEGKTASGERMTKHDYMNIVNSFLQFIKSPLIER